MPKLIGLTGYKRSGKNTAAEIIAEYFDNVVSFGLADNLKIFTARALGFDRTEDELIELMDEFKETASISISYLDPDVDSNGTLIHGLDGRELLQFVGTEGGRNTFGEDFWINQRLPERHLTDMYPHEDVVIVTDVRFDDEAERILDLGGEIWEIVRDEATGDGHASENGIDAGYVSFVIDNNGGLDHLRDGIETALGY